MHFFAHHGAEVNYQGPGDSYMMNDKVIVSPDKYFALYKNAGEARLRGEGSVSTLFFPERSLRNIAEFTEPDFKAIVVLRKPSERAYSSYLYLRGRGHENIESFEQALAAEPERKVKNYHHMWLYREASQYQQQLEPFVKALGDRLLIVVQEEFVAAPEESIKKVLAFLGAEYQAGLSEVGSVNRGGEPKSRVFMKMLDFVRKNTFLLNAVKRLTPRAFREFVKQKNLGRPEMPPTLEAELDDFFAPDLHYVERLLGREIAAWR